MSTAINSSRYSNDDWNEAKEKEKNIESWVPENSNLTYEKIFFDRSIYYCRSFLLSDPPIEGGEIKSFY